MLMLMTFDIKHQPDTVPIDVFHTSENDKIQSIKCQNCIPFLESTYSEMQRKNIINHKQPCINKPLFLCQYQVLQGKIRYKSTKWHFHTCKPSAPCDNAT